MPLGRVRLDLCLIGLPIARLEYWFEQLLTCELALAIDLLDRRRLDLSLPGRPRPRHRLLDRLTQILLQMSTFLVSSLVLRSLAVAKVVLDA